MRRRSCSVKTFSAGTRLVRGTGTRARWVEGLRLLQRLFKSWKFCQTNDDCLWESNVEPPHATLHLRIITSRSMHTQVQVLASKPHDMLCQSAAQVSHGCQHAERPPLTSFVLCLLPQASPPESWKSLLNFPRSVFSSSQLEAKRGSSVFSLIYYPQHSQRLHSIVAVLVVFRYTYTFKIWIEVWPLFLATLSRPIQECIALSEEWVFVNDKVFLLDRYRKRAGHTRSE